MPSVRVNFEDDFDSDLLVEPVCDLSTETFEGQAYFERRCPRCFEVIEYDSVGTLCWDQVLEQYTSN